MYACMAAQKIEEEFPDNKYIWQMAIEYHSAIDKLPINEDLVLEADKGFRQLASKAA